MSVTETPAAPEDAAALLRQTVETEVRAALKGQLLLPIPKTRHVLGDISQAKVYELIAAGELVKINQGRRGFVSAASLIEYLTKLQSGQR